MSRNAKTLLTVFVILGVLATSLTLAAGVAVYDAGMIVVRLDDKTPGGSSVHFAVPGILASLGVAVLPKCHFAKASREMAAVLPALEAAAEGLSRCPDGPFVEVDSGEEHVMIAKSGGSLLIDVDGPDATVHLSVPLRTITTLASALKSSVRSV